MPKPPPAGRPPLAPEPALLSARVRKLQARLRAMDLDAMLVLDAKHIRYLTRFRADHSALIVPARGRSRFLIDSWFADEQLAMESPQLRAITDNRKTSEKLKSLFAARGLTTLGITASTTLAWRSMLVKSLGSKAIKTIKDDGLHQDRQIKSPEEIRLIQKALSIQEQALEETRSIIEPGITEQDVRAELEYRMVAAGAECTSFSTIVAAGGHASQPHYIPSPKAKLRTKSGLLIDWGAQWQGYAGDMTRTLHLGAPPARWRKAYRAVAEAKAAAIAAAKPGMSCRALDKVARDVLEDHGLAEHFKHSLGHGLGLDVHESPGLSPKSPESARLEPGMVVTIEPGVYLPGKLGIRNEDTILITKSGRRNLCKLPDDEDWAII